VIACEATAYPGRIEMLLGPCRLAKDSLRLQPCSDLLLRTRPSGRANEEMVPDPLAGVASNSGGGPVPLWNRRPS